MEGHRPRDTGVRIRAQQAWFSLLWRPEWPNEEALRASGALGGPQVGTHPAFRVMGHLHSRGVESPPRKEDTGPTPGVSVWGPPPHPHCRLGTSTADIPPQLRGLEVWGPGRAGRFLRRKGRPLQAPLEVPWWPVTAGALGLQKHRPTSVTQRSPLRARHRAPGR